MKDLKEYPIIEQLPNPFLKEDGSLITTAEEWQEQREYYKKLLQEVLYGTIPEKVKYESFECVKTEECFNGKGIYEEIIIYLSEDKQYHFSAKLYRPNAEGKFPFVVCGEWDRCAVLEELVCERNFGIAMFKRDELAFDDREKRMLEILYPEYTWGKLAQWGWGHSRLIDYLETTSYALPDRYLVTGHSRGGKASFCAGIYDDRVAVVQANDSGCGGAGCTRFGGSRYGHNIGEWERISRIMEIFPQWFGPGLAPFAEAGEEGEKRFPIDSHIMRAVVAPRVMLSTEGCADTWANPYGTLVSWRAAQEVFHFLGCNNHNVIHYREGGHAFSKVDWNALLDTYDMIFRGATVESKLIYFDDAWYTEERKHDWMLEKLHYDWECPAK